MANETYYEVDKDNNIIDILSGSPIQNTPEERVRQNYIWILINDYGYPKHLIRKEVAIQSGRKLLLDEEGNVVTSHSTNPVPLIYVDKNIIGKGYSLHEGALCDLAPTLLQLMELPVPAEMEGKSLID